jgi:GT2 family glycosyltransferase
MNVSLVIPGRNAEATLDACLEAVAPLVERGELAEILFVDDGSTDSTREIAAGYPVRVVVPENGAGAGGPGAARNRGWRAASSEWIWFIDSDCVAEPGALAILAARIDREGIAGAGGSYTNRRPDSWLARAIHAEIIARHRAMPDSVDFLGSFNVLYRRAALERVGGFDETDFNGPGSPGAEDAELAYRLHSLGYELLFDARSRVGHYHPTRMRSYLRAQRMHGFWRVQLYLRHPRRSAGDSYSGSLDHLQPPLAMLALASLPTLAIPGLRWLAPLLLGLLALAQLPLTLKLIRQEGSFGLLSFAAMSFLRAFARGIGMTAGVLAAPWRGRARRRREHAAAAKPAAPARPDS